MEDLHVKTLETLKDSVVKLLYSVYDFLWEDAEIKVEESVKSNPDLWHQNPDPDNLAKSLASDDADA